MGDYPDIGDKKRRSVLPKRLQRHLADFAKKGLFRSRRINSWRVRSMIRDLQSLPPAVIPAASREIRRRARLLYRYDGDVGLLASFPDLAWLFLFHGDGLIREATLRTVKGPAGSAFLVCAVACQLNHWAPEVRHAADEAFQRLVATTWAKILAEAAVFLLAAKRNWQRGQEGLGLIDDLLSFEEVRYYLVRCLRMPGLAGSHRVLMAIAHDDRLDAYLEDLLATAHAPALRGLIAKALMRGAFAWPDGHVDQWVDKSMGKKRRVKTFTTRPLTLTPQGIDFVAKLASDNQVQVRKVAMQAIIDAPGLWRDREPLIQKLSSDSSSIIRAGMGFIRRQQAKESLDPSAQ